MFERNDTKERFYVKAGPGEDAAVADGLRWLVGYAKDHGHASALLIAPGVQNIGYLSRVIGPSNAATLKKHRKLVIDGVLVAAATQTKLPYGVDGPVLAVWTRDRVLDKIDAMDVPAICAVAWQPENIKGWISNWSPTDVRGSVASVEDPIDNPVVVEAMKSITAVVNVSTGIVHPSDRALAIQAFRLLRDSGEHFDADGIRAWAVRNGWAASDARELAEVAQKVLDRRSLRSGSERMLRDDALDRWRQDAVRSSDGE